LGRTDRHTLGQVLRFGVSSAASAAVSVGLPILLHEGAGVDQATAVAISQCSVLLLNFLMIRLFVFRSTRSGRRDLGVYAASAASFRAGEYLLFLLLFDSLGFYYVLALVLTLGASALLKFFWFRFVFGTARDSAGRQLEQL
jgi:putative flippase GtrA